MCLHDYFPNRLIQKNISSRITFWLIVPCVYALGAQHQWRHAYFLCTLTSIHRPEADYGALHLHCTGPSVCVCGGGVSSSFIHVYDQM